MGNTIKLQLLEDGEVVQEETTENMVLDTGKYLAQYFQSCISGAPHSGSVNTPLMSSNMGISLFANKYSFLDGMYPYGSNSVVGYCNNLQTTGNGGTAGSFLPSLTQYSRNSITYTWEWGTTQGNGTINSMGFTTNGSSSSNGADLAVQVYSNIPYFKPQVTYVGFVTSGSDKIFYFRDWTTSTSNIVGLYESTYALAETLSLTVPSDAINSGFSNGQNNQNTVLSNGHFYTVTGISGTDITFKKASKSDQVYGSSFNIGYTPTSANGTSYFIASMTSDESHIYIAVVNFWYNNGYLFKSMLVTIDTTNDTVTSVVDTSSIIAANNFRNFDRSTSGCIIKDPMIANKLYIINNNSTLNQYDLSTGLYVPCGFITTLYQWVDLAYMKNGGMYIKTASSYTDVPSLTGSNAQNNSITRLFGQNTGGLMTYAEFASPIVKTSAQAMRIQYTLNIS